MSNKFNLDDIKFVDAVIPIPESTVSIEMEVKVYEDGEIHELKASYNLADIREAIDLFEKTWQGEYPKFVLTERKDE